MQGSTRGLSVYFAKKVKTTYYESGSLDNNASEAIETTKVNE